MICILFVLTFDINDISVSKLSFNLVQALL